MPLHPDSFRAINLLSFQDAAFWVVFRICFFLWRRQAGKSYTIASKAIGRMLEKAGRSCFFVSASIATGKEIVEKEATIWHDALAALKACQDKLGKQLGGNVIDTGTKELLNVDDLAELMDKQAAQVRIYHTRTAYSRTKILAPNPDTARGWTGDVYGDEIGFWPDFKAVWDAVEPIISRNPDFLFWLFSTPPADDTHYTYDLLNPGLREFTPCAAGNWYKTEQGYPVHRVDALDAELAGLPLYDPLSGKVVPYEEFRAHSMDRSSVDRNYGLKFIQGGTAAIPLGWLNRAQNMGLGHCTGLDLAGEEVCA